MSDVCVSLLQLLLLNEAALVLVDDAEGLLDVISGLAGHAAGREELLVVECASVCNDGRSLKTHPRRFKKATKKTHTHTFTTIFV